MEKRDIMRIYISETEECFSYDDVKKTIDRFIQKECKSKEVVIMRLNSRSNSVVTKYATEKGVHSFLEKPIAIDPKGYRSIMATAKQAQAE